MRRAMIVAVLLLVSAIAAPAALARGHGGHHDDDGAEPGHGSWHGDYSTVTWWCADLNEVWDVEVPVVTGRANFTGGDPTVSPWCGDPNAATDGRFPVAVPAGQEFMPGGTFIWFTNKTYPKGYRAAIEAQGLGDTFSPHSNSPAEDFQWKISRIRVEIYTLAGDLVTEFTFDARRYLRRIQLGELLFGQAAIGAYADPSLGIDLTAAQVDRLPLFGFTVMPTAPLASGDYFYAVYWTLSDNHWDGMGVDPAANLLPAGRSPVRRLRRQRLGGRGLRPGAQPAGVGGRAPGGDRVTLRGR
jgi:hypothetical protein